jgi:tetratricopeptide (TPR) repeat protein
VKARSSVFRYKGKEVDAKTIANELGVQAILNGRVDQRGDELSLNLELIDPTTENVIWTDQYDRKASDIMSLQHEVARDVSSKLRVKLSGSDQKALDKKYTEDPEAYRLYLQARFYLNKRVGKEFEKAEGYLRQAIARDPNFALAYVGLAEFIGQEERPKAKEYILRAIAIDSELSEAHSALGFQFVLDHEWAASGRELARAIELDPNNARAHQSAATRALMIGQYDECNREIDKAIALEPTLPDLYNNRGSCLVASGRVDEGITQVRKSIEVDPDYAWSYSHLSFLLRMKGDHAGSVEMRARSAEILDRPDLAAQLRDAFREKGWTGYLRELLGQTNDNFRSRTRRASILAELGDKEASFKSLGEALTQSDWWLFSIKYDPAFDPMRSDPRFQEIMMKFEPPQ